MANIRVQRLQDIERYALALSQEAMPFVKWEGVSDDGYLVYNNLACALRCRGETNLFNEWGMMCDPDIADEVVDKLREHLEDVGGVPVEMTINHTLSSTAVGLPVFIVFYHSNVGDEYGVVALRERDNGVMGSRCYGAATVKIETVKDWATDGRNEDE